MFYLLGALRMRRWLGMPGMLQREAGDLLVCLPASGVQSVLAAAADRLDELIEEGEHKKFHAQTRASVFRLDGTAFFCKKGLIAEKPLVTRLRYFVSPSRGFWAAFVAERFGELGIPTPRVLAVAERRAGLSLRANYLVTEALTNVVPLDTLARSFQGPVEADFLPKLELAGSLLRRLHDGGVVHNDPNLSNLYLEPGGGIGFWDLEPAHMPCWGVTRRGRLLDLACTLGTALKVLDENPSLKARSLDARELARAFCLAYGEPGWGEMLIAEMKRKHVRGHTFRHAVKPF